MSVTYGLTEGGQRIGTYTQTCPPRSSQAIPQFYDDLSVDSYTLTGPDGSVTTNPGDMGPYQNMPWGAHPNSPGCYVCGAAGCSPDPLAPTFLQGAEFLFGNWDEGTNATLTVNVVDSSTLAALDGVTVTAFNAADNANVTSATTDASGRATLTLDREHSYYLRAARNGYSTQDTHDLEIINNHVWTMRLTVAPKNPGGGVCCGGQASIAQPRPDGTALPGGALVLFAAAAILVLTRRR